MPLGTPIDEVGWLNEWEGRWILRSDGGGRWRLDTGFRVRRQARRLVGRRVRVRGWRDGFDIIGVDTITAMNQD